MRFGRKFARLAFPAAVFLSVGHSQTLVTADWLQQRRNDPNLLIFDARPEAEYRKGHIPGAIPVNAYDYMVDTGPGGEKAFHAEIAKIFGATGARPKDRIVVYEERLATRAGRAYWMLRYAGHSTVHMLEGGLEAWRKKQFPVSTDPPPMRPATAFEVRLQPALTATAQEIAARLRDPKVVILDVRARGEYDGKSGSADCARQGRIPGAVWIEWTNFMSADGASFQSADQLRALLAKHGITPDKEIVTYCHRGARAAAAWAALDSLGYRKSKNYAGSWHDWAAQKLPVE